MKKGTAQREQLTSGRLRITGFVAPAAYSSGDYPAALAGNL